MNKATVNFLPYVFACLLELDLETESEFEFIPGIDMDDMESEPAMEDELAAVLGGGMEPEEESDLEPDKQMSVEEIAALLQSIPELDEDGEIQQQSQQSDVDDIDMLNLMDMMPEDEGISEINQLLEKNDSGEPVEEDMLSRGHYSWGVQHSFRKKKNFQKSLS